MAKVVGIVFGVIFGVALLGLLGYILVIKLSGSLMFFLAAIFETLCLR